jgi:ABC-type Fe3+ transport system substrate-binding protein
MSRAVTGTSALAVAALLLAACGSNTPANTPANTAGGGDGASGTDAAGQCTVDPIKAQLVGLSNEEREAKLVELAASEGPLNLYGVLGQDVLDALESDFESKYDIDLQALKIELAQLSQKVSEEVAANSVVADVVDNEYSHLVTYQEEGYLAVLDSPYMSEIDDESKGPSWVTTRYTTILPLFRNTLEQPPTSMEDLMDPRFAGKIGIVNNTWDHFQAVINYWVETKGITQDEAIEDYRKIIENSIVFNSGSELGEALEVGDVEVAITFQHYYGRFHARGESAIEWEPPISPALFRPQGMAIMCAAPNPASALLITDYMLGDDAQEIMSNIGFSSAGNRALGLGMDAPGVPDFVRITATEAFMEDEEFWDQTYRDLLIDAAGTVG